MNTIKLFINWITSSEVDVKSTFRNLVTNRYMRNFNYTERVFSFQTVFYQSAYSYCCCTCSFEHEHVDYVSENGDINEEMYQKVLNCILDGKCPHVQDAECKHVRETKIYAIQIAAAVGTVRAVENTPNLHLYRSEGIYCMNPLDIALLKNRGRFVKAYQEKLKAEYLNSECRSLMAYELSYAVRSSDNASSIMFETVTSPTFCVKTRNLSLLKIVLDPIFCHFTIHKDLELAYVEALTDMQKELLAYIRVFRCHVTADILARCAVSAIVYEQDSDLHDILSTLNSCRASSRLQLQLLDICHLLGKHKQKAILRSYGYKRSDCNEVGYKHFRLDMLHYLIRHYSEHYFRELKHAFDTLYEDHDAVNDAYDNMGGFTPLHECLGGSQDGVDPDHAKILMKYGADVDIYNDYQQTPFLELLQRDKHENIKDFRQALVLVILDNPVADVNTSAVEDGINLDERFAQQTDLAISGNYDMDATEHTCFSDEQFALNFIGPLLIECGFYYSTDTLVNAQKKRLLHHTEKEYLNYCLDNPRSLQLSCRDVLRRHFKRRAIYEFVDNSKIPKKIKDYILIKPVLSLCRNLQ